MIAVALGLVAGVALLATFVLEHESNRFFEEYCRENDIAEADLEEWRQYRGAATGVVAYVEYVELLEQAAELIRTKQCAHHDWAKNAPTCVACAHEQQTCRRLQRAAEQLRGETQ